MLCPALEQKQHRRIARYLENKWPRITITLGALIYKETCGFYLMGDTTSDFKCIQDSRQKNLFTGSLMNKKWCVWTARRKPETWHSDRQQSPTFTIKGQSGISRGKGFQESSDTHLLEALQAYLIQVWQQQGGLCYPWRFSSVLHGSRSVILLLGNFQL